MSDALFQLAVANIAASAAILLVMLTRKPLQRRFGAEIAYAIWLIPFLVAAASLLPPRVITQFVSTASTAVIASGPEYDVVPNSVATSDAITQANAGSPDLTWLLATVWVMGMVSMLTVMIAQQMHFWREIKIGTAGPAVVGLLNTRIVIPKDFEARFGARERAVILEHESAHLRRHDAPANALMALLRCICWFNPLIHIAADLIRIDQELACDAAVVARYPDARRTYANALMKTHFAARALPLGCYWPARDEHPLLERIAMLKASSPTRTTRFFGIILVGSLLATGGVAAWAGRPPVVRIEEKQAPLVQAETLLPAPQFSDMPKDLQGRADAKSAVTLKGVVTRVEWINPATRIHVREEGSAKSWIIETADPNTMLDAGGDKAIVQMDRTIQATGYAARDPSCVDACSLYAAPYWMTFDGVALQPTDGRQRIQLWP